MNRTILEHAGASLLRVMIGASIAFAIAIPLGIIFGLFRQIEIFFEPLIEILRPIPPIAWIPISIVIFGATGHIFIVFIGAFFPVLLNTMNAVKNVSKNYVDVARSFNATRLQIILKVILPASFSSILTGIRIGVGVAWMSIIAAEMIALSGSGLGYFILVMYEVGHEANMIAGMIMIGIIGYVMNNTLIHLERKNNDSA